MPRQHAIKPVRLLKRTGNHVRTDLGGEAALLQLGRSYLARPLYPIICNTELEILDGNRRAAAVLLIAPDTEVPVCVIDEPWNDSVKLEIQAESAAHTRGLSDYELYRCCSEWLQLNPGATAKALAGRIHRDEGVLSKLLSLDRCVEAVKAAARDGLIGYTKWHQIAMVPPDQQPAMLADSLSGATRDQLQRRSRQRKQGDQPAVRLPRIKIPLANDAANGTVTVAGDSIDLEDAETLLKEALKAVKAAKEKALDTKTAQAVWRDMAKAAS